MKKYFIVAVQLFSAIAVQAQLYNDAALTGSINNYSGTWTTGANGSYTGGSGDTVVHYTNLFTTNGSHTGSMTDRFLSPGRLEMAGTVRPSFYNLELLNGNAAEVSITNTGGIMVINTATFSNGITTTLRSMTGGLQFGHNAGYNGSMNDSRHINGYVSKTGNAPFVFPVGDGTQYRPLTYITPPADSGDMLRIAYIAADPGDSTADPTGGAHNRANISSAGTPGSTRIVSVSPVGFWDWVPQSGTSPVVFSVSIPDMTGIGGYVNTSEMRLVGWNTLTGQWENLSGTTGASSNTAGTTMTGTVSNMSNYSAIGIGNVGSVPLPVKLLSFTGQQADQNRNRLTWQTAVETPGCSFEVTRSGNGNDFKSIGHVKGKGANQEYLLYDNAPLPGINYYRLKVAETDGRIYFSQVVIIRNGDNASDRIKIAPIPAADFITITNINAGLNGQKASIINMLGHEVGRFTLAGVTRVDVSAYMPGVYMLRLPDGTSVNIVKK